MEILRLRLVIVIARVWCSGVHGNKWRQVSAGSPQCGHCIHYSTLVTPCDQAAVTRGWRHKRGEMSRHAVYQDLSPVESRGLSCTLYVLVTIVSH